MTKVIINNDRCQWSGEIANLGLLRHMTRLWDLVNHGQCKVFDHIGFNGMTDKRDFKQV